MTSCQQLSAAVQPCPATPSSLPTSYIQRSLCYRLLGDFSAPGALEPHAKPRGQTCPYPGQLCDFRVISHRGTRSINQGQAEVLGKTDTADVRRNVPCTGPFPDHRPRVACWAPNKWSPAWQAYLQPDAASNGQGVTVLVMELDVANECLIHSRSMAGRQGI